MNTVGPSCPSIPTAAMSKLRRDQKTIPESLMGRLPGVKPTRGKHKFMANMPKTLTAMFPNGLNMKLLTIVAEGPHVAVQAESDTVAGNGKKYANRYHFYFLFDGDRIAQVREYNDVNLVREVFFG